ncbi:RecF/RecN/SMC protein [Trichodelitschia bisporula]|uniref:RecF/RecN/SMC protein n=1 Tax=Trichodelitschia bisporula TaxID=703511 RepID=A0A6G1HW12_9PEZI|nr:RecF/RecN/SMC protein [Trichodelitschia bisporula]
MSAASPVRPSRRAAAARRPAIHDSDSDDENQNLSEPEEEEYTPAPARSTRRRTTAADVATPKTATRTRKPRASAAPSVEPSQMFDPEQSALGEPISPSKRARKPRASAAVKPAARGKSRATMPPTPQPTVSPEPGDEMEGVEYSQDASRLEVKHEATPLGDITETAVNEVERRAPVGKIDANITMLERPMDIVVRTRAAGIPTVQQSAAAGPQSRIVITYLTLTNFKSYAGKQVVGPFHSSFSSVVGPNGSGKSNVIDSLLFVFGFRASKMRQGKISALIHSSSAFPDLDYCEVEVQFQEVRDLPDGTAEVVPNSQLAISRRAFKNNSSSYYINGKTSNFTVVTTLLRDRGVDLDHKRFLILQGEVESIAQMKPKAGNEHEDGLLEYLEDIIGTSKYKTPIEESVAQVEELNDVCAEKNSRVQHVEKERNSLEDKKNKALAYIRAENELALKKASLYQIYTEACNNTLEVSQESAAKIQAELEEEVQKHEGNEEEIKRLEKEYKTGSKQYEKLEAQNQTVLKEAAKLEKEQVKLEEKKKFLVNKQKKLEKSLESSKFAISEAEVMFKRHTDDIARNTTQIEGFQSDVTREEKELASIRESLKGKTQGLSDQITAKQKSLEPWKELLNTKQSAIAVAQSELEILQEKENAGANAVTEIEAKIADTEETKQTKAAELSECEAQRVSLEKQLRRVQAELDEMAKQEPALRSKLSDSRQKADEARSSLSASQTQGNVLTGLMRLKESGRINGFHGRLGNLGAIDAKYDVAISTACPQLDNLVVDSVENNLGHLSQIKTPENVPRLFDLVKPKDEIFQPAFFSVLQNTLVAKDLGQANRIAYGAQRWRVSGTMSGGGTRVAKGGMSSKLTAEVSREQVGRLEEFQKRQQELERTHRELSGQIPQLETQAQKLQLEMESFDRNIADAKRRIQELNAEQRSSKTDSARMGTLQKTIAGVEKEIAKLHTETADKIMEIGGIKLRSQKAKVDGLKEQIDTLADEMSSAETKFEKAYVEAETEIENAGAEREKLEAELAQHNRNAAGTREAAETAQEELNAKKDELKTLKAMLDEKTAELNETRAENLKVEKLGKLGLQNITEHGEELKPEPLPRELKEEIEELEVQLQNVNVELGVLAEYRRRVEEYTTRSADLAVALRRLRLEGFMEGFSIISLRLKEILDPFSEGILFSKTLSSLALVFALHHYKPTPLNVSINAQFILASRLVGVYKVNHMTKSVTIENRDYLTGGAA